MRAACRCGAAAARCLQIQGEQPVRAATRWFFPISFQVPPRKHRGRRGQNDRAINQRIQGILQDQSSGNRPPVCSHGHHIEILKIRKQIGEPFREGGHCRAHYLDRQVPQLLNVQTHNVQTNGKQDCQQRRGKAGKQQRQCDDQCQLQQYEIHRHQHHGVASAQSVLHVEHHEQQTQGHRRCVHRQRQHQPPEFSEQEFPSSHRFGQQRIERALVHFLGDQRDTKKNRNQQSDHRNGAQPKAHDDGLLDPNRNLSYCHRRGYHEQRKKHQVVKHPVAHRFTKRVQCHNAGAPHCSLTSTAAPCARSASTRFMKNSSSVAFTCDTDRMRAPAPRNCSIAAYSSSSATCRRYRSPVRVALATSGALLAPVNSKRISIPSVFMSTSVPGAPTPRSLPPTITPTRSHNISASERMCEENITVFPSFFNCRIMSRTSRLPTGSSPDIGSSRITTFGSCRIACANPTRCSMPFEYFRSCIFRAVSRPTFFSMRSIRSFRSAAARSGNRAK